MLKSEFKNARKTEYATISKEAVACFDLSLFDVFSNLKLLRISNSKVESLVTSADSKYLPNLETICLTSNQIESLDFRVFSKMQNLKHIDLSHNNLTILDKNLFKVV